MGLTFMSGQQASSWDLEQRPELSLSALNVCVNSSKRSGAFHIKHSFVGLQCFTLKPKVSNCLIVFQPPRRRLNAAEDPQALGFA